MATPVRGLRISNPCVSKYMDLPGCFENIKVLRETDDLNILWWPAEVISITPVYAGSILSVGTVLYDKRPGYGAGEFEVGFIRGELVHPKRNTQMQDHSPDNSWRLQLNYHSNEKGDHE